MAEQEIYFASHRDRFASALDEIRSLRHPVCGSRCQYRLVSVFGHLTRRPVLRRSTHKLCPVCQRTDVSSYDFDACHACAEHDTYPVEFAVYHMFCNH